MAGHHWTPEAPANDFLVPVREGGVLRDYQEMLLINNRV